ncbi:methylamine utilization protein MauE [Acetobacter musti]|uniref:Methylamine utilization protein MauE n=1 Tax=Acetobacter musti TaxID=864732 RepID=A0ABX0JRZ4_9PROT|nr:MauE/DoxX family redox-associated membrane protein [Acetobacter musti]NHN85594.1 methylamine utilization protein MauE [Acetobacter musti]
MSPLVSSCVEMTGTILRGGTGALFFGSGIARLSDTERSASDIAAYRLLPLDAAFPAARLLTGTELLCGGWLLSGVAPLAAGIASAALLLFFAAAMAINVLRGRTDLACGCIPGVVTRVSWHAVSRNIVLAILMVLTGLGGEASSALIRVEGVFSGAALLFLILAAGHLSAPQARI